MAEKSLNNTGSTFIFEKAILPFFLEILKSSIPVKAVREYHCREPCWVHRLQRDGQAQFENRTSWKWARPCIQLDRTDGICYRGTCKGCVAKYARDILGFADHAISRSGRRPAATPNRKSFQFETGGQIGRAWHVNFRCHL